LGARDPLPSTTQSPHLIAAWDPVEPDPAHTDATLDDLAAHLNRPAEYYARPLIRCVWHCTALADNVRYHAPLTDDQANTLLDAYVLHSHGEYDSWRQDHLDAEQALKDGGLLHSQNGPHRVSLDDDVRFSLDHRPSAPADTHAPRSGFQTARRPASLPEAQSTERYPH
jgi:hypothetical protein